MEKGTTPPPEHVSQDCHPDICSILETVVPIGVGVGVGLGLGVGVGAGVPVGVVEAVTEVVEVGAELPQLIIETAASSATANLQALLTKADISFSGPETGSHEELTSSRTPDI